MKKFFANEEPLGQHFGTSGPKTSGDYEIVGVVADAKYSDVRGAVRPMFFRPLSQMNTRLENPDAKMGENRSLYINSITVKFQGNPQDLEAMARRTLANINPDLTMFDFRALDAQVARGDGSQAER